eukprot:5698104-Alexandrium_andersonii.AAC.1
MLARSVVDACPARPRRAGRPSRGKRGARLARAVFCFPWLGAGAGLSVFVDGDLASCVCARRCTGGGVCLRGGRFVKRCSSARRTIALCPGGRTWSRRRGFG